METLFAVERQKVGAVVGHERAFLVQDDLHQLPVLAALQTQVVDVVSREARFVWRQW